jgi:hypothetical protein
MEQEKNKPMKKIRVGALSATVWKNMRKDGKEYPVVHLERSYKDAQGEWKSTTSLRQSDLPAASIVLTEALRYLTLTNESVTQGI